MQNSEIFLRKYRILEGMLEKRYEGRQMHGSSVVMEYIRDDDSLPVRTDLDLLREIRNILSHNAGNDGAAVVEPSAEMIRRLDKVTEYAGRSRRAAEFGTPADRILSAHPNDPIINVMRNMRKNGYSHVPVRGDRGISGVFSIKCVFDYLAENGMDSLGQNDRIFKLGERLRLDRQKGERYLFVSSETSLVSVRMAFEQSRERDSRLTTVFVTRNGLPDEPLICMLTPWDVLSEHTLKKETDHGTGKDQKPD